MEQKKQLSFDLDTNILKQIFGDNSYTIAYKDVRNFMKNNNFVHIEGSVYVSELSMTNVDVLLLLGKMKKELPYITKCVKEMHQTDVGEIHSLNEQFEYDGTPGEFALTDHSYGAAIEEAMQNTSLEAEEWDNEL